LYNKLNNITFKLLELNSKKRANIYNNY